MSIFKKPFLLPWVVSAIQKTQRSKTSNSRGAIRGRSCRREQLTKFVLECEMQHRVLKNRKYKSTYIVIKFWTPTYSYQLTSKSCLQINGSQSQIDRSLPSGHWVPWPDTQQDEKCLLQEPRREIWPGDNHMEAISRQERAHVLSVAEISYSVKQKKKKNRWRKAELLVIKS